MENQKNIGKSAGLLFVLAAAIVAGVAILTPSTADSRAAHAELQGIDVPMTADIGKIQLVGYIGQDIDSGGYFGP